LEWPNLRTFLSLAALHRQQPHYVCHSLAGVDGHRRQRTNPLNTMATFPSRSAPVVHGLHTDDPPMRFEARHFSLAKRTARVILPLSSESRKRKTVLTDAGLRMVARLKPFGASELLVRANNSVANRFVGGEGSDFRRG
jgi:hypothetical protein